MEEGLNSLFRSSESEAVENRWIKVGFGSNRRLGMSWSAIEEGE